VTPASDVSLNLYLAAGCHTFYVVVFQSDGVSVMSVCFIRRWPGDLDSTETHLVFLREGDFEEISQRADGHLVGLCNVG